MFSRVSLGSFSSIFLVYDKKPSGTKYEVSQVGKFFRLDGCQNKRCFGISEDNFFDLNADTATLNKTTTLQPLHGAQYSEAEQKLPD